MKHTTSYNSREIFFDTPWSIKDHATIKKWLEDPDDSELNEQYGGLDAKALQRQFRKPKQSRNKGSKVPSDSDHLDDGSESSDSSNEEGTKGKLLNFNSYFVLPDTKGHPR